MTSDYERLNREEFLKRNNVDLYSSDIPDGSHFCTYRTAHTVEQIIGADESYFFLNSIEKMNDEKEKAIHREQAKNTYALCFCHSDTENIPLWYLYGGITGRGACIRLTAHKLQKFLESIEYVYPVVNKERQDTCLYRDKDYTMKYGWIYYCKAMGNSCIIKHRNKKYELIDNDLENFQRDNFFVKDYAWSYEKEFRIVFSFKGNSDVYEQIAVPFPKQALLDGLTVRLAPNFPNEEKESYKHSLGPLLVDNVIDSNLEIEFDLLSRNHDSFIRNFADIVQKSKEDELKTMCKSLQRKRDCRLGLVEKSNSGRQ